jgi:hypothetical protein
MKLRLLITEECNRNCKLCCNKNWDLQALPVCSDYTGYREIILTGGEPLLRPDLVRRVVAEIREQTDAPIYLYTAKIDDVRTVIDILSIIDGITVTLHDETDFVPFKRLNDYLERYSYLHYLPGKSLRLKSFEVLSQAWIDSLIYWDYRGCFQWIENCPLPQGEVFMRLNDGMEGKDGNE